MPRFGFATFLCLAAVSASASGPIPVPSGPGLLWRGDFESGIASLSNHCASGADGYDRAQIIRSEQVQITQSPLAQGNNAARLEVRHDDTYPGASESRTLLDPCNPAATVTENDERWYRWQVFLPQDYVSDWPKADQLNDPSARKAGGYNVEWHHNDVNGSAPVYLATANENFTLCVVTDRSNCAHNANLLPLVRNRWVDWVVHAIWSSNPATGASAVGLIEIWADTGSGLTFLHRYRGPNKYSGVTNYWEVGLYRDGTVGDPTLRYPDGTQVYPNGPLQPVTVAYFDGFSIGTTMQSVYNGPLYPTLDMVLLVTNPTTGAVTPVVLSF